jgi:hypothetical protein
LGKDEGQSSYLKADKHTKNESAENNPS